MRRLIASEFVTLDGVMEAPGHEEHRDGKNAWALQLASEDTQKYKIAELDAAGAILLGRVTYQIFAVFWPSGPGDGGFADRMNSLPKYVVSTTLRKADWNNSTLISGNIAEEISKLKEQPGGDILIYGSAEAGERQVLVTRTVRDLATGTDLGFTSVGSVGLRGVPGEWELFEASIG
jgi:dihydrofolate reductase